MTSKGKEMKSNVIDQPAKADEDRLNMKAYADALTEFVANAQSPLTIALQGEWGSGKTSLMNALKRRLVDENDAPYFGVWINTWQYALMSDPEEAIVKILLGIIGQITSTAHTPEEERKSLFRKVLSVGRSIVTQIVAKQTGIDIDKTLDTLKDDNASGMSSVESLKGELGVLIKNTLKNKSGYLFFIDDLDRIDPPVAVQILELLKNILDLENCIFVLAIDYGVVVKGLKPKFGEMTAANEREFRSFFDKIIQLPFSMPVSSYKIDGFLMSSLADIGYLDGREKDDKVLCEAITSYALASVGTNPRSLKRLVNYLSLIRLLIEKTETQEDDADLKKWKDVLFGLVSLQIEYPKVYEALLIDPDFTAWGAKFEHQWKLPALVAGEKEKLEKMAEFDEAWEQLLFRFCRRDSFLEARVLNVSRILNKIRARITADANHNQPVGDTVEWLLRLSAVTSVKSEQEKPSVSVDFNRSAFLKDLRWHTLGMRGMKGTSGFETYLSDKVHLFSWQKRVQTNLSSELWIGYSADGAGVLLTEPCFHIFHDAKSFQLKIWGEFWGSWPKEKWMGIDFNGEAIKPDLDKAVDLACNVWSVFSDKGKYGCGCCGDLIGDSHIWWHAFIPFKDHDELVSEDFSNKLRGSLVKLAESFAILLPYRVPTTTK